MNYHPLYTEFLELWNFLDDSYKGSEAIKEKTIKYLPPTSGQLLDGFGSTNGKTIGNASYAAYLGRAFYPEILGAAVEAFTGIMHNKPPVFKLTPSLEPLRERATPDGSTLDMLLRQINTRQLITGRIGLLGDIRVIDNETVPIIVTYNEKTIVNWNDISLLDDDSMDLSFVVLDESDNVLTDEYSWVYKEMYRILKNDNGTYVTGLAGGEDLDFNQVTFRTPHVNGTAFDKIPFAFINSKDIATAPDSPPLKRLANICLAIFKLEADYRQNLFMQGQDTLVKVGQYEDGAEVRTGAGAVINVPMGGDAKYIGVSSNGLSEQRNAIENDYHKALQSSGQLLDTTSRVKESGDALRIRVSAQTATLPQLALAGAKGLENVLKDLAEWLGDDPDEVAVIPNTEFADVGASLRSLIEMMEAKGMGAPISLKTIHETMVHQGVTSRTFDDELKEMKGEPPPPDSMIRQGSFQINNTPKKVKE